MTVKPSPGVGEVLAVIPARGGSKTIPRKNLRLLHGKPLVAHSIEQAKRSRVITRLIVSTDDAQIAQVARQYGAEVPFMRPAELAQDDTPDLPVFHQALTWLREHEGYTPDLVVHLRPTTPTRRVETMDRAIRLFAARPDVDALRSVSPAEHTPYKMWLVTPEGLLEPVVRLRPDWEAYNMPRQALPQAYWGDGYVDVTRPAVILGGSMTGRRILAFVTEEPCVDIDEERDLHAAEHIFMRASS